MNIVKNIYKNSVINITLVLLICSFVFFFVDIRPKLISLNDLKEQINYIDIHYNTAMQEEITKRSKNIKNDIQLIQEKIKYIDSYINSLKKHVIQDKNVPLLTQELFKMADSCKIELGMVKPLNSKKIDNYEILPTNIQFTSNYYELINLLLNITASKLLSGIDKLSIKLNDKIYPQLDISLTVNAVFLNNEHE